MVMEKGSSKDKCVIHKILMQETDVQLQNCTGTSRFTKGIKEVGYNTHILKWTLHFHIS